MKCLNQTWNTDLGQGPNSVSLRAGWVGRHTELKPHDKPRSRFSLFRHRRLLIKSGWILGVYVVMMMRQHALALQWTKLPSTRTHGHSLLNITLHFEHHVPRVWRPPARPLHPPVARTSAASRRCCPAHPASRPPAAPAAAWRQPTRWTRAPADEHAGHGCDEPRAQCRWLDRHVSTQHRATMLATMLAGQGRWDTDTVNTRARGPMPARCAQPVG